ncbi:MAG: alanine--tRNA ligase, partial [Planctomycetes bacterium]|nr:alanine--tRNA ligase [Planctomycetota bacterium]
GLERICAVLQGQSSNYDTDIFRGLFGAIGEITSAQPYRGTLEGMTDVAYRVVADHVRALAFALSDGGRPSNEGRGYVLRRILRRAARYGRQYLNTGGSEFLYRLVPTVVNEMGEAFPELRARPEAVAEMIRDEEAGFNKTLDRGLSLFEAEAEKISSAGRKEIPGQVAFELYATYGFPTDLTELMARERGLCVDMVGYEDAMSDHRIASTSPSALPAMIASTATTLPAMDDSFKYGELTLLAKVLGWVDDGHFVTCGELVGSGGPGRKISLITDRTNFYAESGGQVGDIGRLVTETGAFAVSDTQKVGECVLHVGTIENGRILPGQPTELTVDAKRMDTARNHTATHLLNWALREVLGDHVDQAGSEVGPQRLRFDFTHNKALTHEQLDEIERLVNEQILADREIGASVIPLQKAMRIEGVCAVFGEKYPDPVRVISIGTLDPLSEATRKMSVALCGGTHLARSSQVGFFKIIGTEAIAKGVRRIFAVTGPDAVAKVQAMSQAIRETSAILKAPAEQLGERVAAMQKEIKSLRKKLAAAGGDGGDGAAEIDGLTDAAETVGDVKVVVGELSVGDANQLRSAMDKIRQKCGPRVAAFVGSVDEGKVMLVAAVSDAVIASHGVGAGEWIGDIAPIVGGRGGGKPQLAQAGGKDPARLGEALKVAGEWIKTRL